MRKKIRLEPIVCSILLFLITGTMGIIAYQTDKAFVQNRLLPGWNDGEIIEEFPDPPPIVPGEEGNIVKSIASGMERWGNHRRVSGSATDCTRGGGEYSQKSFRWK